MASSTDSDSNESHSSYPIENAKHGRKRKAKDKAFELLLEQSQKKKKDDKEEGHITDSGNLFVIFILRFIMHANLLYIYIASYITLK